MSSKVSSKKGKKPLDLPLGKAPVPKDAEVDLSHVRLPIETSIFGLNQALALFRTATSEVKRYLAYECELMYECRKCRTIFRSLANFILHKRKYCRDKHDDSSAQGHKGNQESFVQKDIEAANKIIENEDTEDKEQPKRLLNPIIEKLLKKQEHAKYIQEIKNENLKDTKPEEPRTGDILQNMLLEKIDTSNVAVFQTATPVQNIGETEFMKAEVMEIHSIFEENEAAVGSDGKIITLNSRENGEKKFKKKSLSCTECDMKFSTKKTLTYHVKYKHNNSRLVYPCPECKEVLANAWSVYRHLLKIHRKTTSQIRKYRNQIHNGAVCRKAEETPKKDKDKDAKEENDEENEWLDNFEGDNDLQMCGGCGKRFERKAALTSHSVMCTKRIAICNSIKENHAKKKENDDKETKLKNKINKSSIKRPVGSSKRKPENLITYKPKTDEEEDNPKEETEPPIEVPIEIEDSSDSEPETIKQIVEIEEKALDSDQRSDRSESPCRGFVSDDARVRISPLRKLMENLRESENTKKDNAEVESTIEEKSSEEDNGITLNNNNSNENFDLVLCYNESEDMSFQSLVKNMIDVEPVPEELPNETPEIEEKNDEFTVITIVDGDASPLKETTEDSDITITQQNTEENTENNKRKRSESCDESKTKKFVHSSDSSETEDEVFVTRVTAYTNMETLSCSLCNTLFNSLSHLLLHMSIHFSWYRYQCSKCSFMSYNQYDCETHVHKEHQLPFSKMQNMVLPIPTWKTVVISNNFINLEPINVDVQEEVQYEKRNDKDLIVGIIDLTSEDEDSNSAGNAVLDDQNMSKQAILEVILGNERKDSNSAVCNEYTRPPRNRVKSIKTSQKDFIYDMDIVRNRTIKGNCSGLITKINEISDEN